MTLKKKTDFLIIGSGFYGCVLAERIATVLKKNVLIIEKRNHIGGNAYSEIDKKTGIEYHKYGTHIFHTSITKVKDYLQNFTKFNNYRHQVLSQYKNKIYQMPINLETINYYFKKNFNPEDARKYIKESTKKYINKNPQNFEEKALMQIGSKLYEAFVKNYTIKQWGKNPKLLPSSIFNRLPLRFNYNEDYYKNSICQGIPEDGYTSIFNRLIESNKIKIEFNSTFSLKRNYKVKYLTIYTGALDKLFDYKFGHLEWRSLNFVKKIYNFKDYQGTSVINFPELKFKYTRKHEPKHLHPERNYTNKKTLVIEEYPTINNLEPYYPVNDYKNKIIHKKYKNLLKLNEQLNIISGGRLADYAYYDMDMAISAALTKFDHIKKNLL
jgi:UDP-galactopyranose mutase